MSFASISHQGGSVSPGFEKAQAPALKRRRTADDSTSDRIFSQISVDFLISAIAGSLHAETDDAGFVAQRSNGHSEPVRCYTPMEAARELATHISSIGISQLSQQVKRQYRKGAGELPCPMSYDLVHVRKNELVLSLLPQRSYSVLGAGSYKLARRATLIHIYERDGGFAYQSNRFAELSLAAATKSARAAGESIVRDREEIHKGLGILSELRREGLPKHILAPVYHFHPKTAGGEPVCSLYYPLGLTTFSGISDSSILRIKGADARSREVEVRALDRVRFGMDIAEALVDLHARRRCVFDIHSDNVLLTFGKEGRMEANLFDMDLLRSFGKIADLSDFGVECRPWLGMYTLNTMEAGSWTDVIGLMEALDACLFAKSGSDLFMQDLDYWTSPKVEVSDSVADEDRIEALLEQDCYVKKTKELFYKKLLPSATREQIVALQSCSAPDDFARCLTRHGQPWVDPELCRRLSLGIRFYELLREVKRADIRNPEFDTETGRFIPPKQLTAPYILERLGEMHWELQVDVMLQPDLR